MPEKITFSMFITTYNDALSAKNAILSVVKQNFLFKEFIVHDDASNQENADILRELQIQLPQVTFIFNTKNKGVIGSINTCLAHCTGDWIVSVASDDALLPDVLHKFAQMAEAHPQAGLIFGDCVNHDGYGNYIGAFVHSKYFKTGYTNPDEFLENFMMRASAFHTTGAATIWKREILTELCTKTSRLGPYIDTLNTKIIGRQYGVCYLGTTTHLVRVAQNTYSQSAKGNLDSAKGIYHHTLQLMLSPEYKDLFPTPYIRRWKISFITHTLENWIKKRVPIIGIMTSRLRQVFLGKDVDKSKQALKNITR